jgi:hypothetical protein
VPELLADATIDALPQQVRVTVVAGVLLDHVHEHLAQGDLAVVRDLPHQRQVSMLVEEGLSEGQRVQASATTAGSPDAPSKSPSGSAEDW